MPSRQFVHFQTLSRERLQRMIPIECPIVVALGGGGGRGGFKVVNVDEPDEVFNGRFEVAAAYIAGYVAAWRRNRAGVT